MSYKTGKRVSIVDMWKLYLEKGKWLTKRKM